MDKAAELRAACQFVAERIETLERLWEAYGQRGSLEVGDTALLER